MRGRASVILPGEIEIFGHTRSELELASLSRRKHPILTPAPGQLRVAPDRTHQAGTAVSDLTKQQVADFMRHYATEQGGVIDPRATRHGPHPVLKNARHGAGTSARIDYGDPELKTVVFAPSGGRREDAYDQVPSAPEVGARPPLPAPGAIPSIHRHAGIRDDQRGLTDGGRAYAGVPGVRVVDAYGDPGVARAEANRKGAGGKQGNAENDRTESGLRHGAQQGTPGNERGALRGSPRANAVTLPRPSVLQGPSAVLVGSHVAPFILVARLWRIAPVVKMRPDPPPALRQLPGLLDQLLHQVTCCG